MEAGDTQVLPSQDMTTYLAQNLRSSTVWVATTHANQNESGTNETSARTYHTGETGHVNLVHNSNTPEPVVGSIELEESSEDELLRGLQEPGNAVTSPSLLSPRTPGLAGHKRDRSGNIIASIRRTPAQDLAALFATGPKNGALGLSQLFKQTQADSSPALDALRSDSIFDRPSPDMATLRQSSFHPETSSPEYTRLALRRTNTDPRIDYVSMKESQEHRLAALTSSSPLVASDDEDELGENSAEVQIARRKSAERLKHKALKEIAKVGAPLIGHKKRTPMNDADVIVISDDVRQEERNAITNSSDDESMDQYDEYSQTVISSDQQGHERQTTPVEVPTTIPRGRNSQQHQRAISSPLFQGDNRNSKTAMRRSFPGTIGSPLNQPSQNTFDELRSASQSQILAVADSQPDNSFRQPYLVPPPRPVAPSSFDSRAFLSQSQGYSLSSNGRIDVAVAALMDEPEPSSIPFPPPLPEHFQEIEDETGQIGVSPGSSPPVVDLELNLDVELPQTYDEELAPRKNANLSAVRVVDPPMVEQQLGLQFVNTLVRRVPNQTVPETSPPIKPVVREIPDSDPARERRLRGEAAHTSSNEADERPDTMLGHEANDADHFGTAQTHQSTTASATPKRPCIPKLSDIAAGFTPPGSYQNKSGEVTIMNDEDLKFQAAITKSTSSSPPRKRIRRTYGRKVPREPAHESNVQPPQSSPLKMVTDETATSVTTPPSVARRERDGAAAAASVRLQVVVGKDTPRSVGQLSRPASSRRGRPSINVLPAVEMELQLDTPSREIGKNELINGTKSIDKGVEGPRDKLGVVRSSENETPERPTEEDSTTAADSANIAPVAMVSPIVPNRVLAKFRGFKMAYYPATSLGRALNKALSYKVRFDDGTIDEIDSTHVGRLELLCGDVVKVDLPKLRTKSWVVRAFKDRISPAPREENVFPKTDIYGHRNVVLQKFHRQSLPGSGEGLDGETIEIPITSICVPLNKYNHFKDRVHQYFDPTEQFTRLGTPVMTLSLPVTPSSRSRRSIAAHGASYASEITNNTTTRAGIFTNMAFAISYSTGKDADRNQITRMLKDNGGCILTDGFDELFDIPVPTFASPSKTSRIPSVAVSSTLSLLPNATTLGFTALIADSHSRRAKYMQALALNIPCLSGRWVSDCLAAEKIIAWDRYLLPAGESSFLDGAIRSRTLTSQDASEESCVNTKLSNTIERRAKLLEDKNVILVMGEGKIEERRKAYVFLTFALGVKCVERVKGIKAAKSLLEGKDDHWDWVYVDDAKLKEATTQLSGLVNVNGMRTTKKKRDSNEGATVGSELKKPKLVGDEFVMQSLILGALLEDV